LYAHAAGQWAKKIRGRVVYFGKWDDPAAALARYQAERANLEAGKTTKEETQPTIKSVVNHFLNNKQARLDTGELSHHSWIDYKAVADEVIREFGKQRIVSDLAPKDFSTLRNRLAQRFGPHRLSKFVVVARMIFKLAFDDGLLPGTRSRHRIYQPMLKGNVSAQSNAPKGLAQPCSFRGPAAVSLLLTGRQQRGGRLMVGGGDAGGRQVFQDVAPL